MAAPFQTLFINPAGQFAVENLYSNQQITLPAPIYGYTFPCAVVIVDQIPNPTTPLFWQPRDISADTVEIALGRSEQQPIAGTFTGTFGANTTAAIAFDADAVTVAAALNILASVISAGGVDAESDNSVFIITFRSFGARAQITWDASNLAPTSICDYGTLIQGGASQYEVQNLALVQNPATFANLTTPIPSLGNPVTLVQQGGSGQNCIVDINFNDPTTGILLPYSGVWPITVVDIQSDFIQYNASAADVQAAVEALSSVDPGNVSVTLLAPGHWLLMFINDKADTDMGTPVVDTTNLLTLTGFSGVLDYRVPGVQLLLGGSAAVAARFEVKYTPNAGTPLAAFLQNTTLIAPVISPGSLNPQPAPSFLQGIFFSVPLSTITGTIDYSGLALAGTPSSVVIIGINKTAGADNNIFGTIITSSITDTDANYELSGTPDNFQVATVLIVP